MVVFKHPKKKKNKNVRDGQDPICVSQVLEKMRLGAAAATLQLLLLHAATAQMGTPCESFDLSYVTNLAITFSWVANDGTTGSANTTGVSAVSTGASQIFPTGSLRIGNVGRNYATGTVFDMVSHRIITPCALQPPRTRPDGRYTAAARLMSDRPARDDRS
eukprot:33353-Prymnesium_polylepis.1